MTTFTKLVLETNASILASGEEYSKVITVALSDKATREEVLAGLFAINQSFGDIRRAMTALETLMQLRDTGKLSVDTWWEAFYKINCESAMLATSKNALIIQMLEAIKVCTLADKIEYFYDHVIPTLSLADESMTAMKMVLEPMAWAQQRLEEKRRSVM